MPSRGRRRHRVGLPDRRVQGQGRQGVQERPRRHATHNFQQPPPRRRLRHRAVAGVRAPQVEALNSPPNADRPARSQAVDRTLAGVRARTKLGCPSKGRRALTYDELPARARRTRGQRPPPPELARSHLALVRERKFIRAIPAPSLFGQLSWCATPPSIPPTPLSRVAARRLDPRDRLDAPWATAGPSAGRFEPPASPKRAHGECRSRGTALPPPRPRCLRPARYPPLNPQRPKKTHREPRAENKKRPPHHHVVR